MTQQIKAAGYVVTDGAALYGMGETVEQAWNEVASNEAEGGHRYNRDALQAYPVSTDLLAKAGVFGVMWRIVDGVCCTVGELSPEQQRATRPALRATAN